VGVLGRRKTDEPPAPETAGPVPAPVGKGRPTPKRRDAQKAHQRPVISGDKGADRKASRAQAAKERALMNEAMQTGDERYLPPQHKGPVRRFARDWVDARWNLGEFFLPVALVVVVVMFGGSALGLPPEIMLYAILALYAITLVAIIEAVILSIRVRRRAVEKFGAERARGLRLYVAMRAMQLRRARLPKPQVLRGQYPS
jgi:hypothetical protein